jgi:tetratricopeptide (TPR) repeat protein
MFILNLPYSCIAMTDPLSPTAGPPAESRKAKGRGLCIQLVVEPLISKKDIHKVRQRMEAALSDSFSSVELGYYPRDGASTHLKIVADRATFRLDPDEVRTWYSGLLERFLRQFHQDLKELHYAILSVQVTFLSRLLPREQEEDYIPVPTRDETAALLPDLAAITTPPTPPAPASPEGAAHPSPETPPAGTEPTETREEKTVAVPWLERGLADPEELGFRTRALQEYRGNKMEEGIRICLEGLERYPHSSYLLYLLGMMVSSQGRYRHALGILDFLIGIQPDCPQAYAARGRVRHHIGEVAGSEQDRAKARELDPNLVIRD